MADQRRNEKNHQTVNALKVMLILILLIAAGYLFNKFIAIRTVVDGSSMYNTLENGDNVLVNKLDSEFDSIERFDIVVLEEDFSENGYFIKRVIGLPGETIQIDEEGFIYINGNLLEENYGFEVIKNPGLALEPITLAEDEYFVLGDNRNNSEDSRFELVGNIKKSQIVGTVSLRIWPLNKFGFIDLYKERTGGELESLKEKK